MCWTMSHRMAATENKRPHDVMTMSIHSNRVPLPQQGSYSMFPFTSSTLQHSTDTHSAQSGCDLMLHFRVSLCLTQIDCTWYWFLTQKCRSHILCTIFAYLLKLLISCLAAFSGEYGTLPTLAFTHFELAQLMVVGECTMLWIQVHHSSSELYVWPQDAIHAGSAMGSTQCQMSTRWFWILWSQRNNSHPCTAPY